MTVCEVWPTSNCLPASLFQLLAEHLTKPFLQVEQEQRLLELKRNTWIKLFTKFLVQSQPSWKTPFLQRLLHCTFWVGNDNPITYINTETSKIKWHAWFNLCEVFFLY